MLNKSKNKKIKSKLFKKRCKLKHTRNSCKITFEFKIKLVVLGAIGYGHGYIFVYNSSTGVWVGDTEPNTMKLIWNDFEIKYYHHGDAAGQANASDAIYFYIGLG